jgi:hypothetical protein
LTLGTTYSGTLSGSGHAQLFKLEVPQGNPLLVQLDDSTNSDHTEVYAQLGAPPTRDHHGARSDGPGGDHQLVVPFAAPGTWYILVYGENVPAPSASR